MKAIFIYSLAAVFYFFPIISSHADLRNGLVRWWKFDEASGNAIDSSGQGYTGTPTGTTIVSNCKRSGCRSFNGTSDYITFSSINLGTTHSISQWINWKALGGLVVAGTHVAYMYTGYTSGGEIYYSINGSGADGVDYCHFTFTPTLNQWYQVVFIRNGTSVQLFVNGIQIGVTKTLSGNGALTVAAIGSYSDDHNFPHSGLIDDVRIYNRALSAQEVGDLYRPGIMIRNAVVSNARINQ